MRFKTLWLAHRIILKGYVAANKQLSLQLVHFQVNGVTGFIEIEPNSSMWCNFCGQRLAYSALQVKLKSSVHSVMVQFGIISSWRR